jgi:DNA-binding MarR family transcriptional regulator
VDEYADLALAIRQVTLAVQRYRLRAARAGFGAGPTEMMALAQLFTAGPCTPTELAEFLSMTTASITALLDRLEGGGHIVRRRHPTDRRRLLVELNPAARSTLAAMFTYTGEATAHPASSLSPEELTAVRRFLRELVDAYDRVDPLAGFPSPTAAADAASAAGRTR